MALDPAHEWERVFWPWTSFPLATSHLLQISAWYDDWQPLEGPDSITSPMMSPQGQHEVVGARSTFHQCGITYQAGRVLDASMPVSRVSRVCPGSHQAWLGFSALPPCTGLLVFLSLSVLICKTSLLILLSKGWVGVINVTIDVECLFQFFWCGRSPHIVAKWLLL